MIRVYSKNGTIKTMDAIGNDSEHELLIQEGWIHTATLDAGKWIESLMNGTSDNVNDMMDELNFGPTPNHPIFA